jgi:hypothetical protein
MNKQRERLVNLIEDAVGEGWRPMCEAIADSLLIEGGIIVPPCKVGDTVYVIRYAPISQRYYIKEVIAKVIISINEHFYLEDDGKKFMFGEKAFATKEEAEAKLKEGVQGASSVVTTK